MTTLQVGLKEAEEMPSGFRAPPRCGAGDRCCGSARGGSAWIHRYRRDPPLRRASWGAIPAHPG